MPGPCPIGKEIQPQPDKVKPPFAQPLRRHTAHSLLRFAGTPLVNRPPTDPPTLFRVSPAQLAHRPTNLLFGPTHSHGNASVN